MNLKRTRLRVTTLFFHFLKNPPVGFITFRPLNISFISRNYFQKSVLKSKLINNLTEELVTLLRTFSVKNKPHII